MANIHESLFSYQGHWKHHQQSFVQIVYGHGGRVHLWKSGQMPRKNLAYHLGNANFLTTDPKSEKYPLLSTPRDDDI